MNNVFTFFNLKRGVSFIGAFLLGMTLTFAQSNYSITFQDETIEMPENISTFDWSQMPDYSALGGGYYGWIQFYETPNQDVQDSFEARGLKLLNYIPHQTYIFYFPEDTDVQFLQQNGVRSIVPVEARFKIGQNLKNGDIGEWAWDQDKILVTLIHHDNVDRSYVLSELASHQITVTRTYDNSNNLELAIPTNCLEELAQSPYVKWVEQIYAPAVKDDDRGRWLHRASSIDTQTSTGMNYDADGVGVMCRDDGNVGPHIDFEGRVFGLPPINNGSNNTHGDGVSGIMAGAGNRNPTKRGMAAASNLWVGFYQSSFLDGPTTTYINDGSVQITNSSFSNGCNAGYTSVTQTVDTQIRDLNNVLHVFSAGNSNGQNCGYGAGTQWGNITGGHKQAKNCIATASTRWDGALSGFSSRGPAHDGRIKPDIAANGEGHTSTGPNHNYITFGGTSAASPGIAGISAQLYQVYMEENGGDMPNSGLIKAAMLNTANEAGNEGPDFRFGWGIVNAKRAAELILDDRYLSDAVSNGNTNTHTINVPAGTVQVRFMVYWEDPAATPGASPALVNDLDLIVVDPSNNDIQPWVLDATPNPTTLNLPAAPGIDRLNNVEQVLINNPAAGNYDIEITGFNVPQGPQNYHVVYEIIEENLTVIFPNGGEKLFPQGPSIGPVIHWDAVNTTQSFTVEVTEDGGATWSTVGTVPATQNYIVYTTSNTTFTGEAKVRVTSGSFSDESDDFYNITGPRIGGAGVDIVCETEATFSWNANSNAESYDFYLLGDEAMELVGNTTDTFITIPISDPDAEMWFAVAMRNDTDGWVSERGNAVNYGGGLKDCPLGTNDLALLDGLSIFPNPANDRVSIQADNGVDLITEITVTNNLGQVLRTINPSASTSIDIDVSDLATGLYFISVNTENASVTKKLLVK